MVRLIYQGGVNSCLILNIFTNYIAYVSPTCKKKKKGRGNEMRFYFLDDPIY